MAEEKAKPKKSERLKRVSKWIGLSLLALLIIVAMLLGAPWKVTTLLFIILLACTVLPRPARKWFWASVGLVVLVLVIWVFLPDDNEGWRPYTFDKELAEIQARRAIPDSKNAATIYSQLLENYDLEATHRPNSLDWNTWKSTLTEFWSGQDQSAISVWRQNHKSTIDALLQVARIEKCRFPIAGDFGQLKANPPGDFKKITHFWWSPPHFRPTRMRELAELLVRSANNDIAEGRIDNALEQYVAALKMGRHMRQQPELMDILVGIKAESMSLEQIKAFLVTKDISEQQLMLIKESIDLEADWNSEILKVLEREKLMLKSIVCAIVYQTNPQGKIRLNRDPNSTLRHRFDTEDRASDYEKLKRTKAMTIYCWFFVPSKPNETARIVDDIFEKYYKMAEVDYEWKNDIHEFSRRSLRPNYKSFLELISNIFMPAYEVFHREYFRSIAHKRSCHVIIALRKYKNKSGQWPETLGEIRMLVPSQVLTDPINGGSFVYKLTDGGFRLYSKGPNNIDEDGDFLDGDDWLIWPSKRKILEQENIDEKWQNPDIGTKRKRRSAS